MLGRGRDTDPSPGTISNHLAALRSVFGPERVPDATGGRGLRAVGIGTDIARFHELVAWVASDPKERARHLADALSLVRGSPFSGVPGSYGWADRPEDGTDMLTRLLDAARSAAAELARLALDAGDSELALWATNKGLEPWDQHEDLNMLYLTVSAALPDRSALALAWGAVERRFKHGREPVPARVAKHYEELKRQRDQGKP